MKKIIAGLGVSALLLGIAPLAFAQSVVPTVPSTTDTTGTGTTGSTSTTVTGTTGTTATTGTGTTDTGTGTTGTTSVTPGVPNTGAGGDMAANMALLVTSGVIAIGGAAYLARARGARA